MGWASIKQRIKCLAQASCESWTRDPWISQDLKSKSNPYPAFHQGLHQSQNRYSEKEMQFFFFFGGGGGGGVEEVITCVTPRCIQWPILTLLYVALWKTLLVWKGWIIDPQRKKYNIFGKLQPVTPRYIQWPILTLLYVALWKIPLVWKGCIIDPQRKKYRVLKIITMDNPDFIVWSCMLNSIGLKWVANLWVWDISWQHNLLHYHLPPSLTLVSLLSSFSSSLSTDRLHSSARNNKSTMREIVIIFLAISWNVCFGCLKEPSHRDPHLIFWLRNEKINWPKYRPVSLTQVLIWQKKCASRQIKF